MVEKKADSAGKPKPKRGRGRPVGTGKKWTPEAIEVFGQKLVKFCKKTDVFHISTFLHSEKMSYRWFMDLVKRHPRLKEYHIQGKEILGSKIVTNALKVNNNWAIQTLVPFYLEDVGQYMKQRKEEDLLMAERAKKAAEYGIDERTTKLLGDMEAVIRAAKPEDFDK